MAEWIAKAKAQLNEEIGIENILSQLRIRDYKIKCPLCGSEKSFSISVQPNTADRCYCSECAPHGLSVVDFYIQYIRACLKEPLHTQSRDSKYKDSKGITDLQRTYGYIK